MLEGRRQAWSWVVALINVLYTTHSRDLSIRHHAISYWWSTGTEPLSPTVLKIFGPQHNFNEHTNERTNEPTNKHDGSQYPLAEVMKSINNFDEVVKFGGLLYLYGPHSIKQIPKFYQVIRKMAASVLLCSSKSSQL